MVGVQDLHIAGGIDLASGHFARAGGLQHHALGAVGDHVDGDLLQVQDDIGHILAHARNGRELVDHTVNLHAGDRSPLQRGQQHAAQGTAQRRAEATLQRLDNQLRLTLRIEAGDDLRTIRADQLFPVAVIDVFDGGFGHM